MTLTAEQLAIRRTGLTATDLTMITGVSKYGSAIDVLLDKQGVDQAFVETDRVKWGNILEDPIRKDYAERHQVMVDVPGTLVHPTISWSMGTPDGLVYSKDGELLLRGWECKTHTGWLAHLYGEAGSDEVPAWELVQCAWNLYVARAVYKVDLRRWDLTVFLDGIPTDYTIEHNQELETALVDVATAFWEEHVVGKKPLEPDGSDSFSRELAKRWPQHDAEYVTAGEDAVAAIRGLKEIRYEIRDREKLETALVQQIKMAIGDHKGIEFPGDNATPDNITWKRTKESQKTVWRMVAFDLANKLGLIHNVQPTQLWGPAAMEETIASHSQNKPGHRRFVVPRHWNK